MAASYKRTDGRILCRIFKDIMALGQPLCHFFVARVTIAPTQWRPMATSFPLLLLDVDVDIGVDVIDNSAPLMLGSVPIRLVSGKKHWNTRAFLSVCLVCLCLCLCLLSLLTHWVCVMNVRTVHPPGWTEIPAATWRRWRFVAFTYWGIAAGLLSIFDTFRHIWLNESAFHRSIWDGRHAWFCLGHFWKAHFCRFLLCKDEEMITSVLSLLMLIYRSSCGGQGIAWICSSCQLDPIITSNKIV